MEYASIIGRISSAEYSLNAFAMRSGRLLTFLYDRNNIRITISIDKTIPVTKLEANQYVQCIPGGRGNLRIVPSVSLHAVKGSEWIMWDGTGKPLTHSYFPGERLGLLIEGTILVP